MSNKIVKIDVKKMLKGWKIKESNRIVEIDFKKFLKEGHLGEIKLGWSEKQIAQCFPIAEEIYDTSDRRVWNYGGLEFFFMKNDKGNNILVTIFCDQLRYLDMGNKFVFHKWFLEKPKRLKLKKVINELNNEMMEYSVIRNPVWREGSCIIQLSHSLVCFHFEMDNKGNYNTNDFLLEAFYLDFYNPLNREK